MKSRLCKIALIRCELRWEMKAQIRFTLAWAKKTRSSEIAQIRYKSACKMKTRSSVIAQIRCELAWKMKTSQ